MSESKKLTAGEAIAALAAGKKLRQSHWPKKSFIHIVGGRLLSQDGYGETMWISNANFFEIFEEPKKTKKVYRFACEGSQGEVESAAFYETLSDFVRENPGRGAQARSVRRLDHTMIEVERE